MPAQSSIVLRQGVCWLGLAAFLALPLAAQEGAAPETSFHDQVGVEIVNIDVFVTDGRDRPVHGLTREEFELEIDGREVPIANFYAVGTPRPPAAPVPVTAEPLAPTVIEPLAEAPEPLHLVVYFDTFYLSPAGRKRSLRDLPPFLERQIAAGARVMLIAHAHNTRILTPFTRDSALIATVLGQLAKMPVMGMDRTREHMSAVTDIQALVRACGCEDCISQIDQRARTYGDSVAYERTASIAALDSVVNGLSVLEGRKALLHLSDGIEQNPGVDIYRYIVDLCPDARRLWEKKEIELDRLSELSDLTAHANRSRVTLYTLETAGLRGFSSASVEFEGPLDGTLFRPTPETDFRRTSNLQDTLFLLADETGGKAVFNANQLAPELEEIAEDFSNYYSLGYMIDHEPDGKSHRINVKVKQKGVRVRSRQAFWHKSVEQQLADKTMGALMFGATENPLGVTVRLGPPSPGPQDQFRVPVEISVPYERLTLLPAADGQRGDLTLILAAPGERGKRTVVRKMPIAVSLPPAADASGVHRFGIQVDLPAGEHRLGLGIWDEIAATGSFLGLDVSAGTVQADGGP